MISSLGLRPHGEESLVHSVVEALRDQSILLVLDNCEHVIDACAKLADQVGRSCPKVHLLATSREPLALDGEQVYRVPSLSLAPEAVEGIDDVAESDAVTLFAERARGHDSFFVLDSSRAPLVAAICRRLDGIPLALELAAGRLSSMSLEQLGQRLDEHLRLLNRGSRTAPPRQQTLRATIAWSYDLLKGNEQELLRRLSVFSGGFDLEAAEALCATGVLEPFEVDDLLGSLVDKSLVLWDKLAGCSATACWRRSASMPGSSCRRGRHGRGRPEPRCPWRLLSRPGRAHRAGADRSRAGPLAQAPGPSSGTNPGRPSSISQRSRTGARPPFVSGPPWTASCGAVAGWRPFRCSGRCSMPGISSLRSSRARTLLAVARF